MQKRRAGAEAGSADAVLLLEDLEASAGTVRRWVDIAALHAALIPSGFCSQS